MPNIALKLVLLYNNHAYFRNSKRKEIKKGTKREQKEIKIGNSHK